MAEKGKSGPPRILVRRHILEIKEDTRKWIEGTLESFTERRTYGRNSRVMGAAIAAAGVYSMVRLVGIFGRDVANAVQDLFEGPIPTGGQPGLAVVNFFLGVFGVGAPGEAEGVPELSTTLAIEKLKELGQFDPFAFGAALAAGGMVLAGLNPGEILKGIGSIIDALIPL